MPNLLEWENLSVWKTKTVFAISNSFGSIREGRITALIGPSNSGKSVLLQALAGRLETTSNSLVSIKDAGEMHELSSAESRRNHIGFVTNQDELLSSATPREALAFSIGLRPREPNEGKTNISNAQLIEYYLSLFDLEGVADVPFSDLPSLNAKRFATIASEMINERKILLLDAPLWGLFQVGGYQFIKTLKKLVAMDPVSGSRLSGILCSLLQPSSEVLSLFDDVILISDGGHTMYQGPVNELSGWFSRFGHECPQHYNMCDFALFVLHSIELEDREILNGAAKAQFDAQKNAEHRNTTSRVGKFFSCVPNCVQSSVSSTAFYRPKFSTQLSMLVMREYKNILRNWKPFLLTRFVVSIIVSIVTGLVYFGIGRQVTPTSSSSLLHAYRGCILVMCCNAMFANVQATVLALPLQRKIFQREYPLNMYSSIAYLIGKVPIEYLLSAAQTMVQLLISYFLCDLGGNFGIYFLILMTVTITADSVALSISCITDSSMSAIQMLPIVIFPQIIFSGLLVSIQSMPPWISWFQYVCFLPYAMKLLTINEFGCADITVFTNNDISCSNIAVNATILVCFAIFFRLVALVALQFKPKTYK